jgi:hypothetical protein
MVLSGSAKNAVLIDEVKYGLASLVTASNLFGWHRQNDEVSERF